MSDPARDAFLARVRQAVQAGNRPGTAPPLPERGSLGYQGGGDDPVVTFCREFEAVGGRAHVVADEMAATARVVELVRSVSARRVLLGSGALLDRLGLAAALAAAGYEVVRAGDGSRDAFFAADVGVSGVRHLIAETGSLVVESSPAEPRSLSLLPPLHIAVATRDQLLPDLFDLFGRGRPADLPSCLALITGPSKTGDIELRLVTGVHGPGEVHLVLVDAQERDSANELSCEA